MTAMEFTMSWQQHDPTVCVCERKYLCIIVGLTHKVTPDTRTAYCVLSGFFPLLSLLVCDIYVVTTHNHEHIFIDIGGET